MKKEVFFQSITVKADGITKIALLKEIEQQLGVFPEDFLLNVKIHGTVNHEDKGFNEMIIGLMN
jgi:hypothetical protein